MSSIRLATCVAVAVLGLVLGCGGGRAPEVRTEWSEKVGADDWREVLAVSAPTTGHGRWVEIEETAVPGFAGVYLSDGASGQHPIVRLKDPAQESNAREAVAPLLEDFRAANSGHDNVTVDHLEVRSAKYSITELYRWYPYVVRAPFAFEFAVVDPARNAIAILMAADRAAFEAYLAQTPVPADAVVFP